MRIQFRERNVAMTAVLRAQVQRRLALALGRYGVRIDKVVVRLFNGDRRQGAEKQCKIEVDLRPRTVTAQDADNDLLAAVQGAANRVSRSVGRALESERAQDEGSVSPWTSWRPGT